MKKIKLVEVRSELGAGTRGSSLGNDALRVAAWKRGNDFFERFEKIQTPTQNHLLSSRTDTPNAKYLEQILELHQQSKDVIQAIASDQHSFPVILAGDHSSSAGFIAGVKAAYPDKRMGIVWVDAHGDLHSPYTTPSGNVHGMPLAAVLNLDNEACKVQDPDEKTKTLWNKIKNSAGITPKAQPSDVVFFAARDLENAELKLMEDHGMQNYTVAEIRSKGVAECVADALNQLNDCDIIYLSFDVDSMDSLAVSDGTGTPVKDGLMPDEAQSILKGIIDSGKVACFDMVEINPTLDSKGNYMAETAFNILDATVKTLTETLEEQKLNVSNGN